MGTKNKKRNVSEQDKREYYGLKGSHLYVKINPELITSLQFGKFPSRPLLSQSSLKILFEKEVAFCVLEPFSTISIFGRGERRVIFGRDKSDIVTYIPLFQAGPGRIFSTRDSLHGKGNFTMRFPRPVR